MSFNIRFYEDYNGPEKVEFYECCRLDHLGRPCLEVNVVDDQIRNAFPKEYADYIQSAPGEKETINTDRPIYKGIH